MTMGIPETSGWNATSHDAKCLSPRSLQEDFIDILMQGQAGVKGATKSSRV